MTWAIEFAARRRAAAAGCEGNDWPFLIDAAADIDHVLKSGAGKFLITGNGDVVPCGKNLRGLASRADS